MAPTLPSRGTLVLALLASSVAIAGVAAIWAGVAAITRAQCAWMAIVAALDAALLMRLAAWPTGASRAAMAFGITALTIVAANVLVATALIGRAMGLRPFEALPLMSLDLATLHARTNNGLWELALYLLALALAWRLGR